jgi:MerR family transcriptional regulator, light-induced transcriptional regulator
MSETGMRPVPQPPEVGAGLSIQAVSQLLEIPAPTIRSWERRYGVPPTGRSQGGHRRFFPDDLVMLRQMRDEIAKGHRAAHAAARVIRAQQTESPHEQLIDDFLHASYRLDPRAAGALLEHARETLGVETAVTGVLMPAMRQVGVWWETGRCDVAHEHLATEAARAWLNRLLFLGPAPWQPEMLILTCGPRDFHTLGLESMSVLLAHRGYGCRVLGARTPVKSLAAAVQGTGAAGLVMVSHLSIGRRSAIEALRSIQRSGALLFYAGNAFISPQSRKNAPGTYLGEDLRAAADLITASLASEREIP